MLHPKPFDKIPFIQQYNTAFSFIINLAGDLLFFGCDSSAGIDDKQDNISPSNCFLRALKGKFFNHVSFLMATSDSSGINKKKFFTVKDDLCIDRVAC